MISYPPSGSGRTMRGLELIPEILDMVDEKKISMTPAVELSYLKPEEQRNFLEAMLMFTSPLK